MDKETKYRYQKRIKELEIERDELENYRIAFRNVFSVACECADDNHHVKSSYILEQAKYIMP